MSGKRLSLVDSKDPVLRRVAKRISRPGSVADLVADLVATMKAEGGVGLAAPQVGRSVRLFVTSAGGSAQAFVNPEIIKRSREQILWEEGCLSLPRLFGDVRRPKEVTLRAQSVEGETSEFAAEGLFARVLQHELDHLDGVLFPDRMDDLSKLRKVSEEEWESRFSSESDLKQAEM